MFVVSLSTPAYSACQSLKNRYQMTVTAIFLGNVSSSVPTSCSYSLRKTRTIGKNRYVYSGSDCNGIFYDVFITKACNNLSISFPVATEGLAIDSFGNVYGEQSTATLSCNGNLQANKSLFATCSGTKSVAGGSPFVITGSLNGYRTAINENRTFHLSRLNELNQACSSHTFDKDIAVNCSNESDAPTGLTLQSVIGNE